MAALAVIGSTFEGNIGVNGAGLSVHDFCTGTGLEKYSILSSTFQSNEAEHAGGGVYWNRHHVSELAAESCFGCSAGKLGSLELSNVAFMQNNAVQGGGGWVKGLSVALDNSVVQDNVAVQQGGGLWVSHGSLVVSGSLLQANEVEAERDSSMLEVPALVGGGAIYVDTCEHKGFQANYSRILHNRVVHPELAGSGGAIATATCRFTMIHSNLSNNEVEGAGGGAYIAGALSPSLIETSTILGNLAALKGGGFVTNESALHLSIVEIIQNTVSFTVNETELVSPYAIKGIGGGVCVDGGSFLSMDHTVFVENAATQGGGLHVHCRNSLALNNTDFRGNYASHSGTEYFSECNSPWLLPVRETWSIRSSPLQSTPPVGSGPVRLAIESSVEALFEGSEAPGAIAVLALVNINGDREVTDFTTKCFVNASVVEPDGITPGLIGRSQYTAHGGFVNITEFGFSAPAARLLLVIVDCRELQVSRTLEYPVARLHPAWLTPPPHTWSPSSGSGFVPIEPDPLILLNTPYPSLLQGATVSCTAGTRFANADVNSVSSSISLLNPPVGGYINTLNNGTVVPLRTLQVSASYGSTVVLVIECVRDTEILPKLNWTLHLTTPRVKWVQSPPFFITSGQAIEMSVTLEPGDVPGAPKTSCTVAVLPTSQHPHLVIQSATAYWGEDEIAWETLVFTGLLGTSNTAVVNCSTGLHGLPQGKVFDFFLNTCPPGYEPDDTGTRCLPCTGTAHSTGHFQPCRGCPLQGAICENGTLQLLEGYFPAEGRYLSTSDVSGVNAGTMLYKCDTPAACRLTNMTLPYRCATGYRGALCAACDPALNYARSGTECLECWPSWLTVLFLASLVCTLATALVYIAIFRGHRSQKAGRLSCV